MSRSSPTRRRNPVTSMNASSIDNPSTRGEVSRKISKTASLASEYASIRGSTTIAPGHRCRASRPFIAVRTPNRRAS